MHCEVCQQHEATVHDSAIKAGKIVERHLCEGCAKKLGLTPGGVAPDTPVTELLSQFIAMQAGGVAGGTTSGPSRDDKGLTSCPACKLTFAQFRQGGLLGCSQCYESFEPQLAPLMERYHEGGLCHIGKKPKSVSDAPGLLVNRMNNPTGPTSPPGSPPAQPLTRAPSDDTTAMRKRIAMLRASLASAIEAEEYEKAAEIRDELRRLGDLTGDSSTGASGGQGV